MLDTSCKETRLYSGYTFVPLSTLHKLENQKNKAKPTSEKNAENN